MPRTILEASAIHHAVREQVADHEAAIVREIDPFAS
jgi:hypothetical protein